MGIFDKLKQFGSNSLAFCKKNSAQIAMGGGIAFSWTALYLIWMETKKAENIIRSEEEKLNENNPSDKSSDQERLSKKEKAIIYAQYCWPGLAAEVVATILNVYSNKHLMDELAKWFMVSQVLDKKNTEQEKKIEKLEEYVDQKKIHELENDILEEDYPDEELIDYIERTSDNKSTGVLFIDRVTGVKFRADILQVTNGIANINETLRRRREKTIDKLRKKNRGDRIIQKIKDPFFASDKPFSELVEIDDLEDEEDTFSDTYSSVGLDLFWDAIGETIDDDAERRLDEILEFRFYGGGDLLKQNVILKFKPIIDPETGLPKTGFPEKCYIDYLEYLSPSSELIERNPL